MEKEIIYINGIAVRRPKNQTKKNIDLTTRPFRGTLKECSEKLEKLGVNIHPNNIKRDYYKGVPIVVSELNKIIDRKIKETPIAHKKYTFN